MTALDIFCECAAADKKIERLRERIERRKALASGCTARPLSPDGGSSGGSDASMRMLDYVAQIQGLEADIQRLAASREVCRSCCFYLADLLSDIAADVALSVYLEHKSINAIADAKGCSITTVKRYKRNADFELGRIEILHWDRQHVPLYRAPEAVE